jgi:hypothetical protein
MKIVLDIGSSVFDNGMAYVGLSRVTTLHGLYFSNFNIQRVKPYNDVLENKRLQNVKKILSHGQ